MPNEERAKQSRNPSISRRVNSDGRDLVREAQLEDGRQRDSLKYDEAGVDEAVE